MAASVLQNPYQGVNAYSRPVEKLIEAQKYDKAKEILELGLKIYYRSAELQYQMAQVLVALKDPKTAGLYVAAAATAAPVYIDPKFDKLKLPKKEARSGLVNLAWGLYFRRANEKALERFNQAIEAGDSQANTSRGKGFTLFRLGKYKDSLPLLQAAAKLEPKKLLPIDEIIPILGTKQSWTLRYSAQSTLGWVYHRLEQTSKAVKQFKSILRDNPLWIDALTGLGYAYVASEKKQEAKDIFKKALAISPYYPDAKRGMLLAQKK